MPPYFHQAQQCSGAPSTIRERTQRSRIVAIGAAIDAEALSAKFDACIEQP